MCAGTLMLSETFLEFQLQGMKGKYRVKNTIGDSQQWCQWL